MGAVADAWNIVKQELADLKSQNATLQGQVNGQGDGTLDDSDLAAIAELESEAASVSNAASPTVPPALPPGSANQPVVPQAAD